MGGPLSLVTWPGSPPSMQILSKVCSSSFCRRKGAAVRPGVIVDRMLVFPQIPMLEPDPNMRVFGGGAVWR